MKTSFRIILNTRRHTSIQIHSIHSSSEYKIQLREREREGLDLFMGLIMYTV